MVAVLEKLPERTYVYRAQRRGARPALLVKTLPDLLKLWSGGLINDEQFEEQCTLLVDEKAGRPILRKDDDVPDCEIPEGALWRWLSRPTDDQEGQFETDAEIKGAPVADCATDSTRGWQRGPAIGEEIEHPGARELPVKRWSDAGQVAANMCGTQLGYWDAVRLRARMPAAMTGELGREAQEAAADIYSLTVHEMKQLGEMLVERPALLDAFAAVVGSLPRNVSRAALDSWLGLHRKPMLRAEQLLPNRPDNGEDLAAEWKRGQVKLPEADVFPVGASTNAYAGTAQISQTTIDGNIKLGDDGTKFAQVFRAPSAMTVASVGLQGWLNGTGGGGDIVMKLYSGATPGSGSLLATWTLTTVDITATTKYWVFGGATVALDNGADYWFEISYTGSPDASNYFGMKYNSTSVLANARLWIWTGSAWANNPWGQDADFSFYLYDNAAGGTLYVRVSEAASVTQSTTKGAALASTDSIFSYSGSTYTYDQNTALTLHTVGDAMSALATTTAYRYGNITVNASVTVTFAGAATATNSGFKSNPTSADTSSKQSLFTFNNGCTFTNSVGAYNTSNKWIMNIQYGSITWPRVDAASVTFLYSCGGAITGQWKSANNSATSISIGNATWTGFQTNANATFLVISGLIDIPLTAGWLDASPASGAGSGYMVTFIGMSLGFAAGGSVHTGGAKCGGAPSGTASFFVNIYMVVPNTGTTYLQGGGASFAEYRQTQVVPAGLAIADAGTDGEFDMTWSNGAAYTAGDKLRARIYQVDGGGVEIGGTAVYRYVDATLGTARIGGFTNGTPHKATAEATSDNYVYSAACAATSAATPTLSASAPAYVTLENSRNTDPTEAKVLALTAYKIRGVDKVGSMPAASVPTQPLISLGSTGATVDGDAGVTNYVYYRKDGADQGWTLLGSRSGDGIVLYGSLAEGSYLFMALSKSGDSWSQASDAKRYYVGGSTRTLDHRVWLDCAAALDAASALKPLFIDREECKVMEIVRGKLPSQRLPYLGAEWSGEQNDLDTETDYATGRLVISLLLKDEPRKGKQWDLDRFVKIIVQTLAADETRGDLVFKWKYRGTETPGGIIAPLRVARMTFEYEHAPVSAARVTP